MDEYIRRSKRAFSFYVSIRVGHKQPHVQVVPLHNISTFHDPHKQYNVLLRYSNR